MSGTALATNLLGRRVRLHRPPEGAQEEGSIAAVYVDDQGLHFVILSAGHLVHVETAAEFTVLKETDW